MSTHVRSSIYFQCFCVCLLLLVWIIRSEGYSTRRTPPDSFRSLRQCEAKVGCTNTHRSLIAALLMMANISD